MTARVDELRRGDGAGPGAAYRVCERITRTQARNFAYGIALLPADKRRALSAIYAFARRIDDIGDGALPVGEKLAALAQARDSLAGVAAATGRGPVGPPPTQPGGRDPGASASGAHVDSVHSGRAPASGRQADVRQVGVGRARGRQADVSHVGVGRARGMQPDVSHVGVGRASSMQADAAQARVGQASGMQADAAQAPVGRASSMQADAAQAECADAGGAHAASRPDGDHVLIALADAARRFPIPLAAFGELIEGCEADVRGTTYATFGELEHYCRCVAGSIGRLSLGVFGCRDPDEAEPLADALGIALQLTNILRDIREDHGNGRVYLPAEDAARFGCALVADRPLPAATDASIGLLIRFEARRAIDWYARGVKLLPLLDRRSAASAGAMAGIYRRLLDHIMAAPHLALQRRLSLSAAEKAVVAARALAGRPGLAGPPPHGGAQVQPRSAS